MRLAAAAGFTLATLFAAAAAADDAHGEWRLLDTGRPDQAPLFETGAAAAPGMSGSAAVYVRGGTDKDSAATLTRAINIEGWRGKRVRLTLRLRNEGGAWALVTLQLDKSNDISLRTNPQTNRPGAWQIHQFVLDVPGNATYFAVDLVQHGKGESWVDDVKLEEVGSDVPLSRSWRTYTPPNIVTASRQTNPVNTDRWNSGDWGNRSVYGPDPPYNPYAGWAQSTLTDMRNNSSLQH